MAATAGDSPADEADLGGQEHENEPTVGLFGALAVGAIGVGLGLGANLYSRNQAGSEASSPSTDSLFFTRHAEQWSSAGAARAKALFHDLQSTLERHISPGAHSLAPLPHSGEEASDGSSEDGHTASDAQQTQTAAAASDEPASDTTTAGGNADLGAAPRRLTRQQTGALPVPSSAAKETPALEDRASAAPVTPTKKKVAKKRAAEQEQDAVGQNVPALALKARDNETPAEIAELLGVAVADVLWLNPWKRIGPNVALEPGTEVELPYVDERRQKSPRVKKRLIQRGPAGAKRRKGSEEYVVEAVRGSRMKDDRKQYLVHWANCECTPSLCVFFLATEPEPACADGSDEDTWEGADNLSCDRLVAEFESKGPSVPPPAKKVPTSQ